MGLRGNAAIAGYVELKPEKKPQSAPLFSIEQWAMLAQQALRDAGIEKHEVDGIVTSSIAESAMFAPATLAEYLGLELNFAEHIDLGGASAAPHCREFRGDRCHAGAWERSHAPASPG